MKRFLSLVFTAGIVLALGACKEDEAPDARLPQPPIDAGSTLPDAAEPDAG
jgi:hypothetical protein